MCNDFGVKGTTNVIRKTGGEYQRLISVQDEAIKRMLTEMFEAIKSFGYMSDVDKVMKEHTTASTKV
ncbi:hypothetical protein LTR37_011531 [Vermiconidia calcicola]|uniref:Uncharacterized protein n=1 Tax=Vermiconidia calcicola TaxID=1690605 RepID=A0ACC3N1U8_9PEZI|nr:hypothetical protein LTR37_011531 [Vermiconidia calcicola]